MGGDGDAWGGGGGGGEGRGWRGERSGKLLTTSRSVGRWRLVGILLAWNKGTLSC